MAALSDEQQTALQFLARCCTLRQAAAAGDADVAARLAAVASLAAPPPLPQQPLPQQLDASGSAAADSSSGSSSLTSEVVVKELHGRLSHGLAAVGAAPAAALSLAEVADLLRKDEANGYGIMAPSAPDVSRRANNSSLAAFQAGMCQAVTHITSAAASILG
jgi:hypothetical protein